ncbi:hypothetical protein SPFM7_00061 [Salmonella phage SPFM7]|nr:hypothetical protein SPFM7_00061 [Salmonella phage SPFM7]
MKQINELTECLNVTGDRLMAAELVKMADMGADWVELFGPVESINVSVDIISNSQVHPNDRAKALNLEVTKKLQKGIDRIDQRAIEKTYHSAGEIDVAFKNINPKDLVEKLAKSYTNNVNLGMLTLPIGFKFKDLNYPLKKIQEGVLSPIDKRFGAMTHGFNTYVMDHIERLESVWAVLQWMQQEKFLNFTGMLVPVPPVSGSQQELALTTYDDMSDVSNPLAALSGFVAKASTILPKALKDLLCSPIPYIFEVDRMNVI